MARKTDNDFVVEFSKFYQGFSPFAHLNSLTEMGNGGHASAMTDCDVLTPDFLTQGPGLADLTNGTQAGVVDEDINFILDRAVTNDITYAVGDTRLYQLSSTTVTSDATWPHTITNATEGNSIVVLKGNLYYFYNKSSGGDIGKFDLSSTFDDDWGSTVPTGAAALQSALHPVAKKEDIFVFGNGRYLGVFTDATTTLEPTKLDFGNDTEVADVIFHANQWLVAVNSGVSGTNRNEGQIFLYDGSAVSTILSDETGVGLQRIGFLYVLNGIVYVAYQDLSFTGGFKIGFISGRRIVPIANYTGTLPGYHQKTLFKNTILFISNALIYSAGAVSDELPIQISQHADAGFANVGAIAAPFGTPMVGSNDGASNQRLAQFSGVVTSSRWRSIIISLVKPGKIGYIDRVTVLTNHLGSNARCDLQLETNQDQSDSGTAKQISTVSTRLHIFNSFGGPIEDFRVFLSWANGNTTNDCQIRKIFVEGHYVEKG